MNEKSWDDLLSFTKNHITPLQAIINQFNGIANTINPEAVGNWLLDQVSDSVTPEDQRIVCVGLLLHSTLDIPKALLYPVLLFAAEQHSDKTMLKLLHRWLDAGARQQALLMTIGQLCADLNRMEYKASVLLEVKVASLEELSKHPSTAESTSGTFQPSFVSLVPPPMEALEDDWSDLLDCIEPAAWEDAPIWCPIIWEMDTEERAACISSLLAQACTTALQTPDLQQLLHAIALGSEDVVGKYLAAEKIVDLFRCNSRGAAEIITVLSRSGASSRAHPFFSALLRGVVTSEAVEVVQHLKVANLKLPEGFIQQFASHCLESCGASSESASQVRLVRWVCMLLQNVIKDDPSSLHGLFSAIQAFCLRFPKLKDASLLFAAIKTLEGH